MYETCEDSIQPNRHFRVFAALNHFVGGGAYAMLYAGMNSNGRENWVR
jgi:hypothetical protein